MFKTNETEVTNYGARVYYKNPDIKSSVMIEFNTYKEQLVKERFKGHSKLFSRFKKRISGKGIILDERNMKHIEECIDRFYKLNGIGKPHGKESIFYLENYTIPESAYIFDSKKIFSITSNKGMSISAKLDPECSSIVNAELTIINSEGRQKKFTSFIELDRSRDINKDYFIDTLKIHFKNLEKDAGLEPGMFTCLLKETRKGLDIILSRKIELFCELFKYSNSFIKRVVIRRAYEKIPNGHYSDDLFFTMKVFLEDGRAEEMLVTFKKENGPVLLGDMYSKHIFRRCFVNDVFNKDTLSDTSLMKCYSYSVGDTYSEDAFYTNINSIRFSSYKEDCSEGLVGYNINSILRKDLSKVEDHSTIVNSILKNIYGHIYLNEDFDFNDIFKVYMNNSIKRFAERITEESQNPLNGEDLLYESSSDLLEVDLLNVLELSIKRIDPCILNQSITNRKDIKEAFKYFPEEAKPFLNKASIVRTSLLTDNNPDHRSRSIFSKDDYTRLYKYILLVEILNVDGGKCDIFITFENHTYPLIKEVKLTDHSTGEVLDTDIKNCQRTLLTDSLLINKYLRNLLVYRNKIIRLFVLNKFTSKVVLRRKDGLLHMDRVEMSSHKEVDEEIKNILNN